jgi:hypothetical protein
VRFPLKGTRDRDDPRGVTTTSTPLTALRLGEERPGWSDARLARVREQVRAGTYHPPAELVAEALLASSLLGLEPNPDALGWAC